jgi:hypothetical protein
LVQGRSGDFWQFKWVLNGDGRHVSRIMTDGIFRSRVFSHLL